jgi:hypothetical protein
VSVDGSVDPAAGMPWMKKRSGVAAVFEYSVTSSRGWPSGWPRSTCAEWSPAGRSGSSAPKADEPAGAVLIP